MLYTHLKLVRKNSYDKRYNNSFDLIHLKESLEEVRVHSNPLTGTIQLTLVHQHIAGENPYKYFYLNNQDECYFMNGSETIDKCAATCHMDILINTYMTIDRNKGDRFGDVAMTPESHLPYINKAIERGILEKEASNLFCNLINILNECNEDNRIRLDIDDVILIDWDFGNIHLMKDLLNDYTLKAYSLGTYLNKDNKLYFRFVDINEKGFMEKQKEEFLSLLNHCGL